MAILNKSKTDSSNKDYWRTPPELMDDALNLLNIHMFAIDVCCKEKSDKIAKAYDCILEEKDGLDERVDWFLKIDQSNVFFRYIDITPDLSTSFCNPPFSKKWEFFNRAVEQSNKWKKNILMVMPYTPCTKEWHENVHGKNCIIYVPNGRYQFLLNDGSKPKNSCSFDVCLILIVPFLCGNVIINYEGGLNV